MPPRGPARPALEKLAGSLRQLEDMDGWVWRQSKQWDGRSRGPAGPAPMPLRPRGPSRPPPPPCGPAPLVWGGGGLFLPRGPGLAATSMASNSSGPGGWRCFVWGRGADPPNGAWRSPGATPRPAWGPTAPPSRPSASCQRPPGQTARRSARCRSGFPLVAAAPPGQVRAGCVVFFSF